MGFHTVHLLSIQKINFTLIHVYVLLTQMKKLQVKSLDSRPLRPVHTIQARSPEGSGI